jgi:spore germination protein GerM
MVNGQRLTVHGEGGTVNRLPLTVNFLLGALIASIPIACRKQQALSPNLNVENKVAMRTVALYFESPDMLLVAERRDVALAIVVRELFKGSANVAVPRLFPADTVVRGAFLLPEGVAFVDLGGPTLTQGWGTGSHEELMATYSLVQTVVANFPEVRRVRMLVNGQPAETLAGHVSLARALAPMPSLVTR